MTTLANNRFMNSFLSIGGMLLIAGLGIYYISFIQLFLEYVMNMLALASRSTAQYLQIVPLH